jgi:uncharacterized protein YndB with AHSA1/START domain
VINRTFAATRESLFELWTKPDHLSNWLPPRGFGMEFLEADIREGGSARFRMSNHADTTFYARFDYGCIDGPRRIVYVQRFCDEAGNIGRHPAMPDFPEALLTTVTFVEEDDQSTRLTVTSEPFGEATAAEVATFVDERAGMTRGWTGSFDELESQVAGRYGAA